MKTGPPYGDPNFLDHIQQEKQLSGCLYCKLETATGSNTDATDTNDDEEYQEGKEVVEAEVVTLNQSLPHNKDIEIPPNM